jgi:hypothetical protein
MNFNEQKTLCRAEACLRSGSEVGDDTRNLSANQHCWQAQPGEQHLWDFVESPPSTKDPTHNTHLWIVKRAAEVAASNPANDPQSAAIKAIIRSMIVSPNDNNANEFYDRLCWGIWDADEKEPFNAPELLSLTPTYLHHFYDPVSRTNWAHDTDSKQWSIIAKLFPVIWDYDDFTAYSEANNYFREAVRSWHRHHLADAGYYLGLALHFFADPTQPMHAKGFINTLVDRTHGDFEKWANTLLLDSDLWPSPPPKFVVPTTTDPGTILDTAATDARPHFDEIYNDMILLPATISRPPVYNSDWKSKLTPLTKTLLRNAASFTAQFLWVWGIHAQRGWDPNGDDKVKVTGALSILTGNSVGRIYHVLGVADGGGVVFERTWDWSGLEQWYGASYYSPKVDGLIHVTPIAVTPGNLADIQDMSVSQLNCLLTISAEGHLLETHYNQGGNPWGSYASDWVDCGPIRNDKIPGSQAASLVALPAHNPVDAFAISDLGQLLHSCRVGGTWLGWEILPAANVGDGLAGPFNSASSSQLPVSDTAGQVSPLAVIYDQTGFDVFAVSKNGHLIHTYYRETDPSPHWSENWDDLGETSLGGGLRIAPGSLAAVHGANPIDVFAISNGGHLLHLCYANGTWCYPFEDLGGTTIGGGLGTSLVATKINPVDVIAATKDGTLVHILFNGTKWQDWVKI